MTLLTYWLIFLSNLSLLEKIILQILFKPSLIPLVYYPWQRMRFFGVTTAGKFCLTSWIVKTHIWSQGNHELKTFNKIYNLTVRWMCRWSRLCGTDERRQFKIHFNPHFHCNCFVPYHQIIQIIIIIVILPWRLSDALQHLHCKSVFL